MLRLFIAKFTFITLFFAYSVYANQIPPLVRAENVKITPSIIADTYKKNAPILLVSCVDYRFPDEVMDFMSKRGALDKYDNLVIAGGSLGIDNALYPELKQSFLTQLALLKKVHDIKMVILLDHRDCNLYKEIHTDQHTRDIDAEKALHSYHLKNVKNMILSIYPHMIVEMLLMSQDGSVETITSK